MRNLTHSLSKIRNFQVCDLQTMWFLCKVIFSWELIGLIGFCEMTKGDRSMLSGSKCVTRIDQGRVIGLRYTADSKAGGESPLVDEYLSIHYAKSPSEKYRFKPPRPTEEWENTIFSATIDARTQAPACPQGGHKHIGKEAENCLHLNIHSPYNSSDPDQMYPVMVYIHGGSYMVGGNEMYNGRYLAQHGVVVVVIQYRLAILGFLCANDTVMPCNNGFKDQILALKWVKDHIRHFRGDPDRITIFGNSAGGSSVGLHTISPQSKGLFRYAIMQSGFPVAFYGSHKPHQTAMEQLKDVSEKHNCEGDTTEEILTCLQDHDLHRLVLCPNCPGYTRLTPSGHDFRPFVDGDTVPDDPFVMLKEKRYHVEAILLGTVDQEWTRHVGWFLEDLRIDGKERIRDYSQGMSRKVFVHSINHVITNRFWYPAKAADLTTYIYTDWSKPNDVSANRDQYINMFTDLSMVAPSVKTAELFTDGGTPSYLYSIGHFWKTKSSSTPVVNRTFHAIELNYLFGGSIDRKDIDRPGDLIDYDEDDYKFTDIICTLWSNFAKFSNPTPSTSRLGFKRWEQFDSEEISYYYMNSTVQETRQQLRAEQCQYWNDHLPKYLKDFGIERDQEEYIQSKTRRRDVTFILLCVILIIIVVCLVITLVVIKRRYSKALEGQTRLQPTRL